MVDLSSEKFLMNATDNTIAGRVRLFGVQIASTNPVSGGKAVDFSSELSDRVIEFRNGSATADLLFKFAIPVGTNGYGIGVNPYPFMFGNMSILFTDGIFVPALDGSESDDPIPSKTSLIVFYEGA
tara:strand:+ start:4001 stop:4378 length:378 start_codon:yes stop_codon:yes gene_type:complete